MIESIIHVTLNTRHTRRSPRSEVGAEAIAVLRPLIRDGGGEVPGFSGFRVEVTREGNGALYTVTREATPIVTCGLAHDAEGAARLWTMLCDLHQRTTGQPAPARRPRSTPWLGVVLLPGLALLSPQDFGWIGDFERCFAWALLAEPLQ